MAATPRKDDAVRFCRLMLEPFGQQHMVRGRMYPVVAGIEGPAGAPPFAPLLAGGLFPDPAMIKAVAAGAEEIKERFVQEMFE
jgi:hypothetical protein